MVGLYFNTKNMSAILKALQDRKPVELKSEKVELGLVDDLSKDFNKNADSADGIASKAKGAASKLDSAGGDIKGVLTKFSTLENSYKDARKKFKELGVDFPAKLNTEQQQISVYVSDLKELDKALEKASDSIFNLTSGF